MSGRVRFGLLSTARVNERVLAGARSSERAEVIAVASREQGHAAAYAREHGIERAYGSYEALLADPDVEAVYVSLPNAFHLEWALRALAAGKHVLCEKPLGRRAAEVEAAFDAADAAGLLLTEGLMYRHHPQTIRLAELVAAGAVGAVRMIRSSCSYVLADPGDARFDAALGGGALLDGGCFCVDAARLLCGEPVRAFGEQVTGGDGVDVAFAGVLTFAGGAVAHFDCGLGYDASESLIVLGETGSLHLQDPWQIRRPGIVLRRDYRPEPIEIAPASSYGLEVDDLAAAIRGEGAPRLGRVDAVGQARTIEALHASAAEGRAATL
jgi:D-xylose 1-dehydrogenase (NADP+, D-xylono-1,5-lactone-forming)